MSGQECLLPLYDKSHEMRGRDSNRISIMEKNKLDLLTRELNLMRLDMREIKDAATYGEGDRVESLLLDRWRGALDRNRSPEDEVAEADLKVADLLLENKLSLLNSPAFDLGDPIDWNRSDVEPQISSHLTYMRWLISLGKAYHRTKHEPYAEKLVTAIHSFLDELPYGSAELDWNPAFAVWERSHACCNNGEGRNAAGQWNSLSCSARIQNWLNALSFITRSHALTFSSLWRILDSLMTEQAQLIVANPRENTPNQYVSCSVSLMMLSMLFPEFRVSESYFEIGWARLKNAVKTIVFPDASCMERSLNYNQTLPRVILRVMDLLQDASVEYTEFLRSWGASIALILSRLSTPDGKLIQVAKTHPHSVKPLSQIWGEGFDCDECRRLAGADLPLPNVEPSFYLPYGGYCILQSDWSPDAFQLFFKASGAAPGHMHEDCLNFSLFQGGHPVLIEAGNYNYSFQSDLDRSMADYCMSSRGHNSITVDGKGQRWHQARLEVDGRTRHQVPNWEAYRMRLPYRAAIGSQFVFVEGGYHNGFGEGDQKVAVSHSRMLIWVKDLGVLVIDELTPEDTDSHTYQQNWHLAPSFAVGEIEFDSKSGVLNAKSNYSLLQISTSVPIDFDLVCGQDFPSKGWHCYEYNQREPSPDVTFNFEGCGPQNLVTLIRVPDSNDRPPFICEGLQDPGSVSAVEFASSDGLKVHCEKRCDVWIVSMILGGQKLGIIRVPNDQSTLPVEEVEGHSRTMTSLAVDENKELSAYFGIDDLLV